MVEAARGRHSLKDGGFILPLLANPTDSAALQLALLFQGWPNWLTKIAQLGLFLPVGFLDNSGAAGWRQAFSSLDGGRKWVIEMAHLDRYLPGSFHNAGFVGDLHLVTSVRY